MKIGELFEVSFGSKLDLINLKQVDQDEPGSVNFVSRGQKNNGVSARVAKIDGLPPYPAGCLTVALGGSIFETFLQPAPFYTSQNVAVLSPKSPMTDQVLLFYCIAIARNKYRFTFGRHANRTVRNIELPSTLPSWVAMMAVKKIQESKPRRDESVNIHESKWHAFKLSELFDIKKGKRLTKANQHPGNTPFIGASYENNGITGYISAPALHDGNTISLSYNGSVGEAFYQQDPYWSSDDVNALYPKGFQLNAPLALFICVAIRREKYRFSYGRKWDLETMEKSTIYLPAIDQNGVKVPNFDLMVRFIETLPFSSSLPNS